MISENSCPEKDKFPFLILDIFLKKFKSEGNKSLHLKIMFRRDAQVLVIHVSRGTITRGDIIIYTSFGLARNIPERGMKIA